MVPWIFSSVIKALIILCDYKLDVIIDDTNYFLSAFKQNKTGKKIYAVVL